MSEQPEQTAHSRSFVLNNLSESLTVAHLILEIGANERWADEQIPNPAKNERKLKPDFLWIERRADFS